MTTTDNVTPTNKANNREVEFMMGKAMCAWANLQVSLGEWRNCEDGSHEAEVHERMCAIYSSEYEATVICIAMFVKEPIHKVHEIARNRAKAKFKI